MEFKIEEPPINIGADISVRSFEMIEEELKDYPKADEFSFEQKEVITCIQLSEVLVIYLTTTASNCFINLKSDSDGNENFRLHRTCYKKDHSR